MKITNKKIKKLIKESIENILFEEYKGIIGGELKKDPETGKWISDRDEDESGEPIVFDSDERNQLSAAFSDEEFVSKIPDERTRKAIGPVPKAPAAKQKKTGARLFKGKKFKDARWMWGEKAFPGSNVYLIPVLGGSREAAKLMFGTDPSKRIGADSIEFSRADLVYSDSENKEFYERNKIKRHQMSGEETALFRNRMVDFQTRRHLIFDLEAEGIQLMTNLGVNIGEISSMSLDNDIVFVPLVTGTAKNFLASPHMILHALFDTTGESGATEIDKIVNPIQERLADTISRLGINPGALAQRKTSEEKNYAPIFQKLGTTSALRRGIPFTSNDLVSEFMTQEISQQKPAGMSPDLLYPEEAKKGMSYNVRMYRELPFDTQEELMAIREMILKAVVDIRKLLKGKIVIINVV
jgi:hypothetical protein